jgi:hypothetical protein
MTDSNEYTLRWKGRQFGPYSLATIKLKLEDHEIGMSHDILYGNRWISLDEFFSALSAGAVEEPQSDPTPSFVDANQQPSLEMAAAPVATVGRPRVRLVFALLGLFLGFLGAHNFYARHWLTGLLQLILSAVTLLLGFGIIAPWLWAIVEAVVVRKDGDGREMI